MRIGIDATPLLLRSAGVKTWTWHFLKHLANHAKNDQIIPLPDIPLSAPLVHDRSLLGSLETWPRLGLLGAINAPLSPIIGFMTRKLDVFHVSNRYQKISRADACHRDAARHDLLDPAGVAYRGQRAGRPPIQRIADQDEREDHSRLPQHEKRCHSSLKVNPDRIQVIYPGVADHFFGPGQRLVVNLMSFSWVRLSRGRM